MISFFIGQTVWTQKPSTPTFSLEELNAYLPDQKFNAPKKFTSLDKELEREIFIFQWNLSSFYVTAHVQTDKGMIQDSYFRFPNNFSHDTILTLLQKQFGKQNKFHKIPNNALYVWKDKDYQGKTMDIIYHGSCTMTCFPMGIHFISKSARANPSFKSLYQKFNLDFPQTPY